MRRSELDRLLGTMLDSQREVSDLNFTVDRPPQVESLGELYPVATQPAIDRLTPFQTEMVALSLIGPNRRLLTDLLATGSCDLSYTLAGRARFRVNVFSQRGNYSVVLRRLNTKIPTLAELNLPHTFHEVAREKTGLILVTGATGTGKSTTLAALLDAINETKAIHVITLEDPVEFAHHHKRATFNQREMGNDFDTFASGLRAALRQAPKVILVGEMRDRETVEIGLTAAETGHLVLSTLHTIDSGQTINRILGLFEPEEQKQVRLRLADTLRWVITQRLAPQVGGGRLALLEIMGSNLRTRDAIVHGEEEGRTFYEIIEASYPFGWRTFDQACLEAYERGAIAEDTALAYCSRRGPTQRGIDNIKKKRGESTTSITNLMLRADDHRPAAPPPPTPAPSLRLR
ncbi:MAG: PilT/PilU family type 4a pilus ATPase [Verrucomicrobia bacterium]|nr:PilT/PilU family type 4a pilus ATPase [Verrucomicrobiota bacterium]